VNVNILTRALTIDTVDNSPAPSIDTELQTTGTTLQPSPSPVRDKLDAGRDTLYGDGPGSVAGDEGVFRDLIFGDHGAIMQTVEDPNQPPVLPQKIATAQLETVLTVISREFPNGDDDTIFGGPNTDVIIGGEGDDVIDAGLLQDVPDTVIGDNGRVTLNGTETFETPSAEEITGEEFAILSFNFNSSARDASIDGAAGTPDSASATGLPAPRGASWNNLQGAAGLFGNDAGELVFDENATIVPGITVGWRIKDDGGSDDVYDDHPTKLDTHSSIRPQNSQDFCLFEGYLAGERWDTIEVVIDGLDAHYQEYDVYVYLDADNGKSNRRTSVRQISIGPDKVFYLNDPSDHTFSGTYVRSTSIDPAAAELGNYVAAAGFSGNQVVIEILTLGDMRNKPAVSALQVVGRSHPIDRVETVAFEFGGNDTIVAGGGPDLVMGGTGADFIETYGAATRGELDTDIVAGDNARVICMFGRVRHIQTSAAQTEAAADHGDDDVIVTGNGEDLLLGGNGNDIIDTGVQGPYDNGNVKVLSINFNSSVPEGEITGVAGAVAVANWNNLSNSQASGSYYQNYDLHSVPRADDLVFADGLPATGILVEWGESLDYDYARPASDDSHDQLNPDTQNGRLFEGYLYSSNHTTLGVNVTGLDRYYDAPYDVYVYLDADHSWLDTHNSTCSITDGSTTFHLDDPHGNTYQGRFVEVTSTDPLAPDIGNYVVFRDVTGTDFSIRINGDDAFGWTSHDQPAISALQIVGGPDKSDVLIQGDFDRDVVLGDNGKVWLFNDVPYELISAHAVREGDAAGQFQADSILTGNDGDIIVGGNDNDRINGQAGDDLILGDNARVLLFDGQAIGVDGSNVGCAWDDLHHHHHDHHDYPHHCSSLDPYAVPGIELLDAEIGGDDRLEGSQDDDLIYGQFGHDTFVFVGAGLGSDRLVEAGDGDLQPNDLHDTLDLSAFLGRVDVDLGRSCVQVVNGGIVDGAINLNITLFSCTAFEDVIGSDFADDIEGNERNNTLIGGSGDDGLRGECGDDVLLGMAGDDVIFGGCGNDLIDGGDGNDTLRGDQGCCYYHLYSPLHCRYPAAREYADVILGGDGDDYIRGDGGDDRVDGQEGDDDIWGGTGDDILLGGPGADDLIGDLGNDALFGDAGNDYLNGGFGHDTLSGGPGDDVLDDWFGNNIILNALLGGIGETGNAFAVHAAYSSERTMPSTSALNAYTVEPIAPLHPNQIFPDEEQSAFLFPPGWEGF